MLYQAIKVEFADAISRAEGLAAADLKREKNRLDYACIRKGEKCGCRWLHDR